LQVDEGLAEVQLVVQVVLEDILKEHHFRLLLELLILLLSAQVALVLLAV
jgi:hypothetical protein